MDHFGARLRAARKRLGRLKAVQVAANALGADSTAKQRRDFANYLSRIERGGVKDPGFQQLQQLARGLGFNDLSAFFAELEKDPTTPLPTTATTADNSPVGSLDQGGVHVSPADVATHPIPRYTEADAYRIGREIAAAFLKAMRLIEADRPTPSHRDQRSRRKAVRRRRRPASS